MEVEIKQLDKFLPMGFEKIEESKKNFLSQYCDKR